MRERKVLVGLVVLIGLATAAWAATPTLTLTPNATCYTTNGGTVTVEIVFTQTATVDEILGGQFFLTYDPAKLDFVSAVPAGSIFTREVYESVNEPGGTIDYAVGLPDGPPNGYNGTGPFTLATITFNAIGESCNLADLVTFRTTSPYVTRLTKKDTNGHGIPLALDALNDLPAVTLDWTAPSITTAASAETVECDGAGNATDLSDWLASHGGAAASDTCSGVTWTHDFTALSDLCGATGAATVTFTATDACGNHSESTATFTIADTVVPTITTAASAQTVECDGAGNATELNAWLDSHGGAAATDVCSGVTWSHNFTALSDLCGATGAATVTFTATDACGNHSDTIATFTIADTVAPTIDTEASASTVECDGAGNTAQLNAWLDSHGGAAASDVCSGLTWSHNFTAPSDLCGATGAATVTFTATDACGNHSATVATFTIADTVAPTIDTAASASTVECDGAGNTAQLNAWLDSHGGAAATDVCSGVTWSHNFTALSDLCGATGAATVTFTATDACGNHSDTIATFTIADTVAPTIDTAASASTVECDGSGNAAQLNAWLDNHGGAAATDVCSGVTWSHDFAGLSDLCGATGAATVTFTATDACGNHSETAATFTIVDTTVPSITTAAGGQTVACDGSGNTAQLNAWLANNGGAAATDVCSGSVSWTNNFTALSDLCGATGAATVTFTATDACGNHSETTATFTIEDTTAPSITTAASAQTVECDGSGNTAQLNAWLDSHGGAAATDVCSGSVTWTNDFAGLSDLCGATGAATVTFTATDACGNESETTATFTIEDTTAPQITTAAGNQSVECDGSGNAAELSAWLAAHAGAAATDVCSGVTWSHNFTALSDLCGATGAATVTFSATDACGNHSETTATFTIADTTVPSITTAAGDLTVECDGAGNATDLADWLAAQGGAAATDVCSGVTWSDNFAGLSDLCGATGAATVTFIATDACGNHSETTATFTIMDTTDPVVTPPANDSVECDGAGNTAALNAWLASATATDTCAGSLATTPVLVSDVPGCGGTYVYTYKWTATDPCANASESAARTFSIVDTTAPVIDTCPIDITVNADAGVCTASVEFGGAAAHDLCGGMHPTEAITYWVGLTQITSPYTFPQGMTTVTVKAKDACDNVNDTCTFDVTVLAFNTFVIDVQLEGALYDPHPGSTGDVVTRCITFTFTQCPSGTPMSFDALVTFSADNDATNGLSLASPAQLITDLPCGVYNCVTAEDDLHSLQVRLTPTISDAEWVASFTEGDMLIGGDLYNDNLVDIADFGTFISEWGQTYGGNPNTTCSTAWPHADINGDAAIGPADYAYISTHFLLSGDPDCCASPFVAPLPRTEISVSELTAAGVRYAWRADFNSNGMIDLADVQAFLNGAVPPPPLQGQKPGLNAEPALEKEAPRP